MSMYFNRKLIMHKASHADLRLAGEDVPDPDLKCVLNSRGIEEISFKWVKEITIAKEQALQDMILHYNKP